MTAYRQISLWQLTAIASRDPAYSQKSLQQLTSTRALSNIAFNEKAYSTMSLQLLAFKARRGQHSLIAFSSWSFAEASLDDFDQLDLEMSLSFPGLSRNQLQTDSFCRISFGQMELYSLDKFSYQLDLDISLSLRQFSFHSCSSNSFEKRALHCAALLFRIRFSNKQLQTNAVQSFQLTGQQLTGQQLSFSFVSGGAQLRAFQQTALQPSTLPASTLISLSLAFEAWLNSSKIACIRRR